MMKKLILAFLLVPALAFARGGGHSGGRSYSSGRSSGSHSSHSYSSHRSSSGKSYTSHKSSKATKAPKQTIASGKSHNKNHCASCKRGKNGKIARSSKTKKKFERQSGYPHGRKGYVVDHVVPLKKGGKDDPSNMQWQTTQDAKEKDKTE